MPSTHQDVLGHGHGWPPVLRGWPRANGGLHGERRRLPKLQHAQVSQLAVEIDPSWGVRSCRRVHVDPRGLDPR
eukprot:5844704-Pyramimonas_sp.AAC.1